MSAILKQLLDDLELNDVVYFFGTNKCFEDFYTERGGVPFDATSYDNSFFFQQLLQKYHLNIRKATSPGFHIGALQLKH